VAVGLISGGYGGSDPLLSAAPESGYYLGLESSCPPEYTGIPIRELIAEIDAWGQADAADTNEMLDAGFRPRTASAVSRGRSGFESGGALDVCTPDGPLAGLADAATREGRLAQLDDDELIGVLRAWHRLESWCHSGTLAVIAELARRRPAEGTAPAAADSFPDQLSEFIGDEVAAALTLTGRSADIRLELSLDLATKLPGTARALHEGIIDPRKAHLIADLTRVLSRDDARAVEASVLPAAGQQTTGQLRAALRRAVLAADPEAATRRREQAQKDPRVRRWQEDAGTAALAGYGLPPADVLEADQRLTDRALALRDAGLPGSLEELRARAYLETLLGQDSAQSAPSSSDGSAPARPRRLATRVTLTVPLTTQFGQDAAQDPPSEPGNVAGFGPVDPALARELATRAAAHPASRFCVTVTGADGQPIAHGCIPGRPPGHGGSPGFTATIRPLAGEDCDHRHQEPGYQPSRTLQHLIWARSTTCSAPGCARPAARCDLDHTVPHDQSGRTCECNLAPLCRHHHRCKQSLGWHVDQPSPGTVRWTTPAGRRYLTIPDDDQALAVQ
jgi:hypothetical protein